MGSVGSPDPVMLICGILVSREDLLPEVEKRLITDFGAVRIASDPIPFRWTSYYDKEMGTGITRRLLVFRDLICPGDIARIKLRTNEMEADFASDPGAGVPRPVNLDPGYMDGSRIVLATTKDNSHRIYLAQGIYAELTLSYRKGAYRHYEWTYPDYRSEEYKGFFEKARLDFLRERAGLRERARERPGRQDD
ncbi:MAG TPA: DUF4416 family protein [Candidatus Brocadiia bacterium]|nr:DUF4416 family protein [Candidatus Brocadiia bacterium]